MNLSLCLRKSAAHVNTDNSPSLTTDPLNIVLVDDDKLVLQVHNELLQLFGHKALVFEQPIDAASYLELHGDSIDVLITDYTMPKMNGLELIQKVFQYGYNIPALILTGFPESVNVDQATLYHAKVLCKPVEISLLERHIRAC